MLPAISNEGLNCNSGSGQSFPLFSSSCTTDRIVESAMLRKLWM